MEIINIGKFPPPIGGVSYFLQRLKPYLDKAGMSNTFYDISGLEKEKKEKRGVKCKSTINIYIKLLFSKSSILVFHSIKPLVFLSSVILNKKHKIVIFSHGETLIHKARQNKRFYKAAIKNVDYIVATAPRVSQTLSEFYPEMKDKFLSIPFILYPLYIDDINDPEVNLFRNTHKYMLSGYACYLRMLDGIDLYGVDLMIELTNKLRLNGFDAAFSLLLPQRENEAYYSEIKNKIREYKLESHFLVIEKHIDEASSLYKISDIYVRPTITDGDSFSVRESLYVGTPVLASDVIERPDGCVLFKSRDLDDLVQKAQQMLIGLEEHQKAVEKVKNPSYEKELLTFFNKLQNQQ